MEESVLAINVSMILDADIISLQTIVVLYNWIVFGVVCQIIVGCGVVTNIINIICFAKQGFKDQINISLLAMATCDIGSLLTLMVSNICLSPPFRNLDLPFEPVEVQYLISGMPHALFARFTAWITAFITLERCLCIALPLQVKTIITNRRVYVILAAFVIIMTSSQAPVYVVNSLGWKYFPDRNKTLVGIIFTPDRDLVEGTSYIINNVFLPFSAFVIIIVCTITLAILLHNKTKWRLASTTDNTVSAQNTRVARLVVILSLIFIACFIPVCIMFVVWSVCPEYSFKGKYRDVAFMIGGVGCLLESINSSVNIFVYYRMSTKYRETFTKLFSMEKKLC